MENGERLVHNTLQARAILHVRNNLARPYAHASEFRLIVVDFFSCDWTSSQGHGRGPRKHPEERVRAHFECYVTGLWKALTPALHDSADVQRIVVLNSRRCWHETDGSERCRPTATQD